jgi:antitoxin VapB
MATEIRIKLLRSDGEQVIEIPPEFELPGEDVIVRREGDALIVTPKTVEDVRRE